MKVLSLDLSTEATGWAVLDSKDKKIIARGVIKPTADLKGSDKHYLMAHSVAGIIDLYRPDELVAEDTFLGPASKANVMGLKILNRLVGQIQHIWTAKTGKSVYFYMAVTARKSIPDLKGNSPKEEILKRVNSYFNIRITDHNIADAIVVGFHHVSASETVKQLASSESEFNIVETQPQIGGSLEYQDEIPKKKERRKRRI